MHVNLKGVLEAVLPVALAMATPAFADNESFQWTRLGNNELLLTITGTSTNPCDAFLFFQGFRDPDPLTLRLIEEVLPIVPQPPTTFVPLQPISRTPTCPRPTDSSAVLYQYTLKVSGVPDGVYAVRIVTADRREFALILDTQNIKPPSIPGLARGGWIVLAGLLVGSVLSLRWRRARTDGPPSM